MEVFWDSDIEGANLCRSIALNSVTHGQPSSEPSRDLSDAFQLVAPEVLETIWRERGVARRVLNIAMP